MKRLIVILINVTLLLLVGCQKKPANHVETLQFLVMGQEAEVIKPIIKEFEYKNPGIKVIVQNFPVSAAHEKLLAAFVADALPDISQLGNTWVAEFALMDALEPLKEYVNHSEAIQENDYFSGIWQANIVNNQLFGIPWYVDTRLLFYRKDMFRAAKVDLPIRTWDEWERAMELLKKKFGNKNYPILMPLNEYEQLLSFLLQQNEEILKRNDSYGNFESQSFGKALHFYHKIFAKSWAPMLIENQVNNVWQEFFNGTFAMYLSGPWNISQLRKYEPKGMDDVWGTMPLPSPAGRGGGIAGGASLVIFRHSKHKQAAWALIQYLSTPEVQGHLHSLASDLPPRRSTWRLPILANDLLARAFKEQLEHVRATPKVLEWEQIKSLMRNASEGVVRSNLSEKKARSELNDDVNTILEKRRWILQNSALLIGN